MDATRLKEAFMLAGRSWTASTMLLVASLLVAACTSPPQVPGQESGEIDTSGTITTNAGGEPDTIDPQKESFVNEVAQTMMVFEGLMTLDAKTLRPIPAAAKEDPKISADGLTYTFTLRDGLKYSDGSPVTAKDFAYGWSRLCDPVTAGDYAFTGYVIVGCEAWNSLVPGKATPAELKAAKDKLGIKVNGDKEISFTLVEPAPYFPSIAGIWVGVPSRESDVTKGGDRWTEPSTFIGNGPFKLTEWKHNDKLVFERNDNYRTPAKLKKWTKVMINDGAVAFAAYRGNELDFYGVAAEDLRTVEGDPELKSQVVDVGGSCTNTYLFNTKKPPFTDVKVRQAFAKSFDRDDYIKNVQKIGTPALSFIPPGRPGYDPQDSSQKYDPAAAKALLQSSSFFGKPELANLKFTYATSPRGKTRVEWVQQQWKTNLGLDVALDPVDSTTLAQLTKRADTNPQFSFLGWCEDYPDPQDWLTTVFHSQSTVIKTGYSNPDFDKLTRDADRERDPVKRLDLYQKASRLLSQDAPAAFLYYATAKYLKKPWVKGVTDSTLDFEYGIYRITDIYVTKRS